MRLGGDGVRRGGGAADDLLAILVGGGERYIDVMFSAFLADRGNCRGDVEGEGLSTSTTPPVTTGPPADSCMGFVQRSGISHPPPAAQLNPPATQATPSAPAAAPLAASAPAP